MGYHPGANKREKFGDVTATGWLLHQYLGGLGAPHGAPNSDPMSDILSLNQLISQRAREHPDLLVLAIPDKDLNYIKYTASEIDAAASFLANYLKDTGALPGREKGDATSRLTVGLLGVNDIGFIITELALYRMGYCVLFISPNNSPPAIAHLLTVTNSSHIIVQDTLFSSATEAVTYLVDPSLVSSIIRQPSSDVFGPDARAAHPDKTHWDPPLNPDAEHLLPINIIHSSGSSGFPKAIILNNKTVLGSCKTNLGLTALTTMPLYHGFGHASMLRAWYAAKPLYVFPTASIPLTLANIVSLLSQAPDAHAFYAVPFALRLLAEAQEGLRMLKRLKVVTFSGSPCPDDLGDFLVSEGVPLVGYYGMTEMGQLMSTMRDFATDKEWNWMRVKGPHVRSGIHDYSRFEPRGSGTYELVVLDGWPTKVMTNRPDGSYATKDLFIKHPTIPDAYKYIGRLDDTLVMMNGEKTNPVPIELKLRASPCVADAIVFGSGRTQIGALILPTAVAQHLSHDEFTRRVASTVALANAEAPSHSQLSTEALVCLPYGTQIPRSDKGFILRAKAYKAFERLIEDVYERLEGEAGLEGRRRVEGEAEARVAVREIIGRTIEKPTDRLGDDTDLFEFGLDSLQSTRIRNAIQREIDLGEEKLPINAVFEYPSIAKLGRHILLLSSGKDDADVQIRAREFMLELVDKYSHFMYSPKIPFNSVNGQSLPCKVVVLTGVTGFLGAHILNELLADPEVTTVYCPCRAEDDAHAAERLVASLKTRKLLEQFSNPQKRASERVVALAADLSEAQLGLDKARYRRIANRATTIIHSAWPVNFNLDISSFEAHIRGAVNLMHLALSSSNTKLPAFFFVSSISSASNWLGPGLIPEAVIDDPGAAKELGYAQSKWVVEKLCQIAAQKTPLHTAVLRIGQMVGDTTNGIWNESISVSLVIKCADTIGALPDHDEQVSWLPVDYAAKAIVEIVNVPAPQTRCSIYHIVQSINLAWSTVLGALEAAQLQFIRLPRHEWLKVLRASDSDERRNPSRKLLTFYEGKYGGDVVKTGVGVGVSVDKTLAVSQWLREIPVADQVLIAKWVQAWRESGFLRPV